MCRLPFVLLGLGVLCGCANLSGPALAGVADSSAGDAGAYGCTRDGDLATYDAKIVADPQYELAWRMPALGATVCNGVVHSWVAKTQGTPKFTWSLGPRHTAGNFPVTEIIKSSADGGQFTVSKPFVWAGPGTHVHLVARNEAGAVVLDPFFEYDIAPAEK